MANRFWVGGTDNWDATAGTKWALTTGGAGGQAVPGSSDTVFFDAASGAVTVTKTTTTTTSSVDFTGFTGTFAGSGTMTINASLTLGSGMTMSWIGTLNLTGTGNLTSNGIVLSSLTLAVSASITLQDALNVSGTLTVTAGSFIGNGKSVTIGALSSSNSNTRTVSSGGTASTWEFTGTGTIWNTSSTSGLSISMTLATFKFSANTALSRSMLGNFAYKALQVTAGSGSVSIVGTINAVSGTAIDCTGFTGSLTGTVTARGDILLVSGMTACNCTLNLNALTGADSTITTAGVPVGGTITLNSAGGGTTHKCILQDDLTSSSSFTLTEGAIDFNGKAVQFTSITGGATAALKNLTLGAANLTLTGAAGLNLNATGLTFSGASSTITLTGAGATFAGAGLTFGTVNLNGGGTVTLSGANIYNTFSLSSGVTTTVNFAAGVTQTATTLNLSGDSTHLHTLQSSSAGSQWTLSKASGSVVATNVSLMDSNATGGATFTAGSPAADRGNNTGWNFIDPIAHLVNVPASQMRAPY